MKKIKLFVDAHVFDGIPQGTVTFISGIYSELIRDPRFEIYVGSRNFAKACELLNSDNFIHLKYDSPSRFKRLVITIPSLLRKHRIDFAHFQYITPFVKPCKYIVTIHDLLFLEFPESFPLIYRAKNHLLFRLSGYRADMITTVSRYSAKTISKHFHIAPQRIKITPNSPNLSSTSNQIPVPNLLGKEFILYVSRIEPRKNQALMMKTWRDLKLYKENLHIVIVGSIGIEDAEFFLQLNKLSTEERVYTHWLQRLPAEQLNWLYSNCKLFVFPSEAEGFGIPPLEAAICGAKVLCSNQTAMEDFSFFGEFMFNPNSKEEFKKKLQMALCCTFPHEKVISLIKKTYDWGTIAKNFAEEIINEDGIR